MSNDNTFAVVWFSTKRGSWVKTSFTNVIDARACFTKHEAKAAALSSKLASGFMSMTTFPRKVGF